MASGRFYFLVHLFPLPVLLLIYICIYLISLSVIVLVVLSTHVFFSSIRCAEGFVLSCHSLSIDFTYSSMSLADIV